MISLKLIYGNILLTKLNNNKNLKNCGKCRNNNFCLPSFF